MTIIYFIVILGITVFIHELGHFIFAKKAGVHVYEFAIGMGPKLYSFERKNDETTYSIRLFPIGGFVQMAGESNGDIEEVPKDKLLSSKTWTQRFLTIIAGIVFNFILAIVIFFFIAIFNGAPTLVPVVAEVEKDSKAFVAGFEKGDQITKVNGINILSLDHFLLELSRNEESKIEFNVTNENETKQLTVTVDENPLGIKLDGTTEKGFLNAISYSIFKTLSIVHQMVLIIWYLLTGALKLSMLAGPIGIYSIVGEAAKFGFVNLMYLNAVISINVAFINLLPIPAFDGGRLLFLLIEKIKGKPVDPKVENTVHALGFAFLMILMVVITFNDILRIFK
jgi:regulator of sigma E protease